MEFGPKGIVTSGVDENEDDCPKGLYSEFALFILVFPMVLIGALKEDLLGSGRSGLELLKEFPFRGVVWEETLSNGNCVYGEFTFSELDPGDIWFPKACGGTGAMGL